MQIALSGLDIFVFFSSLAMVMGLGIWVSGKDANCKDYFLAGGKTPWWGVAGSIFGSNISANHIVGMLGVGYSIGFAQSHFEIGAVVGLLFLCYVLLPIYKKLNIYTLSEYLAIRYDEKSRLAYVLIMVFIIVMVMMVPGFYIGSRSLNILLTGDYEHVSMSNYQLGILAMAIITGSYTIWGGLKAVIVTDVFQSILLLIATAIVAYITFSQPEIGGWNQLMKLDAEGKGLMHLYLPADHPELPWTGVLTGLYILHFYYWGTNQFIVQRALSAKSMKEARYGILFAGATKLLIPFLSIATGIAAYYLFSQKGLKVDQDAAFTTLATEFIQPLGFGLLGFVAAGLVGAILSSLDSMINSASTMLTFDVYKRYIHPDASEEKLIRIGKYWMVFFIIGAALIAAVMMDPNSKDSFFFYVARHQAHMIPGVVVVFALGVLWPKASARGAFAAILMGVVSSYSLPVLYSNILSEGSTIKQTFGQELNFLHNICLAAILALVTQVAMSFVWPNQQKSESLSLGLDRAVLKRHMIILGLNLCMFFGFAWAMVETWVLPVHAGVCSGLCAWVSFVYSVYFTEKDLSKLFKDDRFYSGMLTALAVFIMFYFY